MFTLKRDSQPLQQLSMQVFGLAAKGIQRKEEGGELWLVVRIDFRGMCQSSGSPWALRDDVFSSHLYSEISIYEKRIVLIPLLL